MIDEEFTSGVYLLCCVVGFMFYGLTLGHDGLCPGFLTYFCDPVPSNLICMVYSSTIGSVEVAVNS